MKSHSSPFLMRVIQSRITWSKIDKRLSNFTCSLIHVSEKKKCILNKLEDDLHDNAYY